MSTKSKSSASSASPASASASSSKAPSSAKKKDPTIKRKEKLAKRKRQAKSDQYSPYVRVVARLCTSQVPEANEWLGKLRKVTPPATLKLANIAEGFVDLLLEHAVTLNRGAANKETAYIELFQDALKMILPHDPYNYCGKAHAFAMNRLKSIETSSSSPAARFTPANP